VFVKKVKKKAQKLTRTPDGPVWIYCMKYSRRGAVCDTSEAIFIGSDERPVHDIFWATTVITHKQGGFGEHLLPDILSYMKSL
jgi:hypothetical protein